MGTPSAANGSQDQGAILRLAEQMGQALATKRYVENGIVSMELPEDRTVYLVQVRNPDGSTRIVEEMAGAPESKAPAATEAKE